MNAIRYKIRVAGFQDMKIKTSITVDKELLEAADAVPDNHRNRSEVFERALKAYVARFQGGPGRVEDLEIINAHADEMNSEARDVLEYQVSL